MNCSKNKGSEWNVWDLHVHTPASFDWKGGRFRNMSDDESVENSCRQIIQQMNTSEPIAFSIMDYFTFDGVLKIREFCKANPGILKKTIFPGMELRIEAPTDKRLNIHVIFAEHISDQKLKDFKTELKILSGDHSSLSDEAIIECARGLSKGKAKTHGCNDYETDDDVAYELGCKTIVITRDTFSKAVNNLGKDNCLVILPYSTYSGINNLDWEKHPLQDTWYLQCSDFLEARNQKDIDLILGNKTPKNKSFFEDFQQSLGGPKPVLAGSDAHKIEDYGVFPGEKKTWLKAEPTFKGLRQVTIEPSSRCFIGEEPKKLKTVKSNSTKFISKIEIKKVQNSNLQEKWFNSTIHFSSELIAIIGNKGSGKSALADILGLLGNSEKQESFSFLNKVKFKKANACKAKNFQAVLYWENGDRPQKLLNAEYEQFEPEKIKYIPQSYLEKICNETESEGFDKELKTVIFSHISHEKRLGYDSLASLLEFKTEEIYKEISNYREDLKKLTKKIISDRQKNTEAYKTNLTNQLAKKIAELKSIKQSKPTEVQEPDIKNIDSDTKEKITELNKLKSEEDIKKTKIIKLKDDSEVLLKNKAILDKSIEQIKILKSDTIKRLQEIKDLLGSINYRDTDFLTFNLSIVNLENESKKTHQSIEKSFLNQINLTEEEEENQEKIKNLSHEIDEPNQKYQKYLSELKIWNQQILSIQGDEDKPDTINYLEVKLIEINNVPAQITEFNKERDKIVKNIHGKIKNMTQIYKEFHAPVQEFLNTKPFKDDEFKISFKAEIVNKSFEDKFFNLIDRSKTGTFYGIDNSEKEINQLLDSCDFDNSEKVIRFVNKVFDALEENTPNRFENQVKNKIPPEDLYNMIFGLEYLNPRYFLQLNNKNIEQLSPGERGVLLLIFYLMVDKDDRPLVLDQPEENLDNQTIYTILVPCIKEAKKKRQIFLVTHNPNLAVVCDAEQIIVASIDKSEGNIVEYHPGAIENPEINKKIMDILEGTKPAFTNREKKYHKT